RAGLGHREEGEGEEEQTRDHRSVEDDRRPLVPVPEPSAQPPPRMLLTAFAIPPEIAVSSPSPRTARMIPATMITMPAYSIAPAPLSDQRPGSPSTARRRQRRMAFDITVSFADGRFRA